MTKQKIIEQIERAQKLMAEAYDGEKVNVKKAASALVAMSKVRRYVMGFREGLNPYTLDEFRACECDYDTYYYVEFRNGGGRHITLANKERNGFRCGGEGLSFYGIILPYADYGKTYRCWRYRPSDEKREEYEWDDLF